jgi:folate-dependent phosphoribosylglycinamide formyltransferase PurN
MAGPRERLSVVVLTSIPLGIEVAAALRALPEVGQLTLLTAPAAPDKSLAQQLRDTHRYEGLPGLLRAALRRARKMLRREDGRTLAAQAARRCPSVAHFAMARFHSKACHARIEAMAPDLGVVVGTHILRSDLFSVPRLGCINLHLGAAPEFRGSSPGFYEMLEGVAEVGVTVHRVTDTLDGGNILLQERFPLDIAPEGDPLAYLRRYVAEVLGPNGIRMTAAAVVALARGTHAERPQDASRARTRRRALWALKRVLRRTVAERRVARPPVPVGRLTFRATDP